MAAITSKVIIRRSGGIRSFVMDRFRSIAPQIVAMICVLIIWEVVPGRLVSKMWVSPISAVVMTLWSWISSGSIWIHVQSTAIEMLLGFFLGCIIALLLGFLFGINKNLSDVLMPFITAIYSMPKVALAPLLVLMFGLGLEPKILLVSFSVFFVVFQNAYNGFRDVDRDLMDTIRIMGASKVEIFRIVQLPWALTWVFNGMRISLRYALTGAVVAEIISSNRGLGFLIAFSANSFDIPGLFASILIIVLIAVGLNAAISITEASTSQWRSSTI